MKNENYNVVIKTLDDGAMYREICKRMSEIDRNRFYTLWFVPLVSGLIILLMWLDILQVPGGVLIIISLYGALITFFLFRWARYRTRLSMAFKKHAALLESRKSEQENLDPSTSDKGPYSSIIQMSKNGIESAVYTSTIVLWLLTLVMGVLRFYRP